MRFVLLSSFLSWRVLHSLIVLHKLYILACLFFGFFIFFTSAYFWSWTNKSLEQLKQIHFKIFLHSSMKPTWYTGLASSMWPKWPGHCSKLHWQVLQKSCLSTVPILRSLIPPSNGLPCESTIAVLSIFATDILTMSSGFKRPNWMALIFLVSAEENGIMPPLTDIFI